MKSRRTEIVSVLVLIAVGVSYAVHRYGPLPKRPAYAAVPTSAYDSCGQPGRGGLPRRASDGLGDPSVTAQLWVDQGPDGGVALWLPGMNAPCRTILTHLSKAEATAFARSVDDSGPLPSGIVNCPNDDGSGVTVFLTYPERAEAEVVRVGLSGCSYISAPGRTARDNVSWDPLRPFPSGLH